MSNAINSFEFVSVKHFLNVSQGIETFLPCCCGCQRHFAVPKKDLNAP